MSLISASEKDETKWTRRRSPIPHGTVCGALDRDQLHRAKPEAGDARLMPSAVACKSATCGGAQNHKCKTLQKSGRRAMHSNDESGVLRGIALWVRPRKIVGENQGCKPCSSQPSLPRTGCIIATFPQCESGGIGRRTRLRIWRGNPWGFESPLSHHVRSLSRPSWACFRPACAEIGPRAQPPACFRSNLFGGCDAPLTGAELVA